MSHGIQYIEFKSGGLDGSKDFFSKLFGWTFNDMGPDYATATTGGEGAGAGFGTQGFEAQPSVAYITVEDIEAMLAKIEEAGGKIAVPKTALPENYGHIAQFDDPHGVRWGLWSK